jgi:hypothetical protein
MNCDCCQTATTFPGYRMFNPACLHCGVRIIQSIGTLQIAASEASKRRTAQLKDWVAFGHSEAEIRRLVKGPLAIAPQPASSAKAPKRGG